MNPGDTTVDDEITLTLPSSSRFIAMARVAAASFGAELGLDVERIEELRVAVNELLAVLIEWAEDHGGDTVELRFTMGDDDLAVAGEVRGADAAVGHEPDVDVLTAQILSGVTDGYELVGGRGHIRKLLAGA